MCSEFLFGLMKKFWTWIVVMVGDTVNILNAPEIFP